MVSPTESVHLRPRMNRRLRVPAALLALLALSANFADGAGASPCPPDMESHASTVAPDAEDAAAHAHHAPAPETGEPPAPRSDAPACPQGMAGTGNTCISASLPVLTATVAPGRLDRTPTLAFLDDTRDRLVVVGHFRPPQA
jgi:hypothetical protein